jgi:hypothetical protein
MISFYEVLDPTKDSRVQTRDLDTTYIFDLIKDRGFKLYMTR